MKDALLVISLLALWSCTGQDPLASPGDIPSGFSISDSEHGGRSNFHFLPPLVAMPSSTTVVDPSFLPFLSVDVCLKEIAVCTESARVFHSTSTASDPLTLESDHYLSIWHTDEGDLQTGAVYRIYILAGSLELGHADIIVVNSGSELKNADTGENIALKDGRTLPVKFLVETGIRGMSVIGESGGVVTDDMGRLRLTVSAGAVHEPVLFTVESTSDPGPVDGYLEVPGSFFELQPNGLVLDQPAKLEMAYDATALTAGLAAKDLLVAKVGEAGLMPFGGSVDLIKGTITADIPGFSSWGLAANDLDGDGYSEILSDPCRGTPPDAEHENGCSIPHLLASTSTEVEIVAGGTQANVGVAIVTSTGDPLTDWSPDVVWSVTAGEECVALTESRADATVRGLAPSTACQGDSVIRAEVKTRGTTDQPPYVSDATEFIVHVAGAEQFGGTYSGVRTDTVNTRPGGVFIEAYSMNIVCEVHGDENVTGASCTTDGGNVFTFNGALNSDTNWRLDDDQVLGSLGVCIGTKGTATAGSIVGRCRSDSVSGRRYIINFSLSK